jgi:hypothetical protein
VAFPHSYTPPAKYPGLSDHELIDVACQLTQDLIDLRDDRAKLAAQLNSRFFRVFLDAQGESVAGRNRLAEADTAQLTNEKVECEANIAATEDLCALVRTILDHRSSYG